MTNNNSLAVLFAKNDGIAEPKHLKSRKIPAEPDQYEVDVPSDGSCLFYSVRLKAFSTEFPEAHCYLFYLGEYIKYIENITVMPFATALVKLVEILSEGSLKKRD